MKSITFLEVNHHRKKEPFCGVKNKIQQSQFEDLS